jgi:hypothetical protein
MTLLLSGSVGSVGQYGFSPNASPVKTHLLPQSDEIAETVASCSHLAAVLEGLARAKRREFATYDEVEAAFRRFGLVKLRFTLRDARPCRDGRLSAHA